MEQPSTESVSDVVITDKETTLESNELINVHECIGHKVKTQLNVTGW